MRRVGLLLTLALMALGMTACSTGKEIRLDLRLAPKLEITGSERVLVGPVLLEPRTLGELTAVDLAATRELEQFIRQVLRRRTRLEVLRPGEPVRPPVDDLETLVKLRDFWLELGRESGAQIAVAASIDVKVLDREGYTTEEYVSPQDGKTYFRQVLVEETGFSYDVLLIVMSCETGAVLHREQITDFQPRSERKLREYQGMFSELYHLENRLLGVFVPRTVAAKRVLFSG